MPLELSLAGSSWPRGLEREGGTTKCQLGSSCSVAALPSHLLVVIVKH